MPLARAVLAPVPSSPRATKPPGAPFRAFPRRLPGSIRALRSDRRPIAIMGKQDSESSRRPGDRLGRSSFPGGRCGRGDHSVRGAGLRAAGAPRDHGPGSMRASTVRIIAEVAAAVGIEIEIETSPVEAGSTDEKPTVKE